MDLYATLLAPCSFHDEVYYAIIYTFINALQTGIVFGVWELLFVFSKFNWMFTWDGLPVSE